MVQGSVLLRANRRVVPMVALPLEEMGFLSEPHMVKLSEEFLEKWMNVTGLIDRSCSTLLINGTKITGVCCPFCKEGKLRLVKARIEPAMKNGKPISVLITGYECTNRHCSGKFSGTCRYSKA